MDESLFNKLKSVITDKSNNTDVFKYLYNFVNFPIHINPYGHNCKTTNCNK